MILSMGIEPDLRAVVEYLTTGMVKADSRKCAKAIKVRAKNYLIYERKFYRTPAMGLRLILAEEEQIVIIEDPHDEIGHCDFGTTCQIATNRYWWPRMRPDVARSVRCCDPCQKTNPFEQSNPYGKMPIKDLFHT